MPKSWSQWRRLFGSRTPDRTPSLRPRRARLFFPRLEDLEDRAVPAAAFVPNEVLVQFRPGLSESMLADARSSASATLERRLGPDAAGAAAFANPATAGRGNLELLTLPAGVSVSAAIDRLSRHPAVAYAEPNYILTAADILPPDDASFGTLWGLHNTGQSGGKVDADINALGAWEITTGSKDVVVFVVDSGVDYTHPDLAANMWTNPGEVDGDGIDNDGNGYVDDVHGWNAITDAGDPMDDNNHGTHVAGTIGAVGNNGVGVAGVNWNVKIGAVKFLGANGSGAISDAVEGFIYINTLRSRGVNVVVTNNSWGGGGFSQALMDAMAGPILHAVAAGNANSNNDATISYPSGYNLDNIISVAATDRNDLYASFSSYGATRVDLAAPGVSILSTTPNNTYSSFSGTSMATPHVSGAAALIAAAFPGRSALQVKQDLMLGADVIGGYGNNWNKPTMTNGRLNAYQTLINITDTDAVAPAAVTTLGASPGLSSATLTWTATGDDGLAGTAHDYDVRYSKSPITAANWASATPASGEPRPQAAGATETFRARGLTLGTTYYFAMKVRDNLGNESGLSNVATVTTLASGTTVFSDGFEGTWPNANWTVQSPWGRSSSTRHGGTYSLTDSPSGNYANNANVAATSAVFSLVGVTEPQLTFWHRYALEANYDYGYAQVSTNGTSWTTLASYTGSDTTWKQITIDLAAYEGKSSVQVRFLLTADSSIRADGWYVDDVSVFGVVNPNQSPTANGQSVSTNEDTAVAVTLTGSDPENNPLTFGIVGAPAKGTLSGTAPNLTYTPAGNYNGSDSFTFRVFDGTSYSNTATVNITVSAVNDAPVANGQSVVVKENQAKAVVLAGSDVDGDPMNYVVVDGPAHGKLTGTAPNLTYTPDTGYAGPDGFTFRVNDGTVDSEIATVSITVQANTPPVATPQSVTTSEDTSKAVVLAGSDAEGDALTFAVVGYPAHGKLTGTAPNLIYTPDENYYGPDSFTFRANDGTADGDVATVSITVTPVNDAPAATPQSGLVTAEDTGLPITLSGTDIDGDALTYAVVTGPANGKLSGTAPNLVYTPNPNYYGPDGFTFRVNDGTLDSPAAAVSITVTPVDDPVALYFSLVNDTTVGGLSVANEDVIAWDGGTGFTLFFDGSAAGLSTGLTIDAFTVIGETFPVQVLLSFSAAGSVPGIGGTVDDSDVVLYTEGSGFSMYFDGSDVGLTTSNENVDAIERLSDGSLLISTSGSVSVTGASGSGQDVLRFIPTSLGGTTAGSWQMYFDGSDVNLSAGGENVDAVALDGGNLYLSTSGNFSVSGVSGANEDVFVFTPTSTGSSTAGTYGSTLFFDGSAFGLSGNDVTSIDLPAAGGSALAAPSGSRAILPPDEGDSTAGVNGDPLGNVFVGQEGSPVRGVEPAPVRSEFIRSSLLPPTDDDGLGRRQRTRLHSAGIPAGNAVTFAGQFVIDDTLSTDELLRTPRRGRL